MKTIAVIGGGITGVTTAYALAKRGFSVTLFERHRYAAMETSFANGGQLSASNAEVWTHWSTILKGLKWMLKSDAGYRKFNRPFWRVWRVGSGRASAALGTDRAQIGGSCVGFRHRGATQRLSA